MTHEYTFCRAHPGVGQLEITVEYEVISWGSPGSYWEPPEGLTIELGNAYETGSEADVILTDEEEAMIKRAIYADPPEPDFGPDD